MTPDLLERIDAAEATIRRLEAELAEIRRHVVVPQPSAAPVRRVEVAAPAPRFRLPEPPEPAKPAKPPIDWAGLLGARALAWAGGLVTLLGVVFFFVLAVDRGWIGPVARVSLGGAASALLLVAGVVVRRRYGQLHAALAAVASGIAGGYATLLAATALYELVPPLAALPLASLIAALGVAIALAWSAELVAGLGLVGATLVPVPIAFEGGLSIVGTAFAGLVFAATAIVAVRQGWARLLIAGTVASLPQIAVLVLQQGEGAPASVVALATAFWLVYLATGVGLRRRGGAPQLANGLVLLSATLAAGSAFRLLNGTALGIDLEGLVLLAVAAVYGVLATALLRVDRDGSALAGAVGLAVSALGFAELLGGDALAVAWAVQAALLAWLAGRLRELRYGAAALVYLGLAAAHTLAFEAPLRDLFTVTPHPALGAPVVAATAIAALLVGLAVRRWPREAAGEGRVARLTAAFAALQSVWVWASLAGAGAFAVYAVSLTTLELARAAGASFGWGHVAVTTVLAALAVAALLAGSRRGTLELDVAGVALLGAAAAKAVFFDLGASPLETSAWSAAAVAIGALVGGLVPELLRDRTRSELRSLRRVALPLSGVLAGIGAHGLGGDLETTGTILLAAALGYGALAALARASAPRDVATLVGLNALALGLAASVLLLDGTVLVAAWALTAAVLARLAVSTREPRLLIPSLGLTGIALLAAVIVQAPPTDLLVASRAAADGAPAVAFALLALLALAAWTRPTLKGAADVVDRALTAGAKRIRSRAAWGAGVFGLYAATLVILELPSWLGGADLTTEFQRGHTAVSTFWGLVGLGVLYAGLTRRRTALRLAGFGLLGVSLAKLFLYDLSVLSSVTRALSFLAVGAVLLLAGFFHQRLAAQAGENNAHA